MRGSSLKRACAARYEQEICALERKLDARPAIEKAFYDDTWMAIPMLTVVGSIWALELAANLQNGDGWSAVLHLSVILPLELLVIVAIGSGIGSAFWRVRQHRLRSKLDRLRLASTHR